MIKPKINIFVLEFSSSPSRSPSGTPSGTRIYWRRTKFHSCRAKQNLIHKRSPLPPQSPPCKLHIIWSSTVPRLSQSTYSPKYYGPFTWGRWHPSLLVCEDYWYFSCRRSTSQQTRSHSNGLSLGAVVWPQHYASVRLEIKASSSHWICGQWRWTTIRFPGSFTCCPRLSPHPGIPPWSHRWSLTTVNCSFRDWK